MVRFKGLSPIATFLALPFLGQAVALHGRGDNHAAHRRLHEHAERAPSVVTDIIPGPTVVVYQFDGQDLPLSVVCEGIKNGTFIWADNSSDVPDCELYGLTLTAATSTPAPTVSTVPTTVAKAAAPETTPAIHVAVQAKSSAASAQPSTSVHSAASTLASSDVNSGSSGNAVGLSGYDAQIATNSNVNKEFPDGQLDCSTFPSAYGAVPVDWVGLGGWSGIQYTTISGSIVSHINTAITGNSCTNPGDGSAAFCSYACPAGYQKSQWPSTQGSSSMAVSVGGLQCGTDGKLHLTNPTLSKYLCIPGTGQVNIQNKLSASNAICRTDYPGTEDETVPLVVQKSAQSPLTCPDASSYYKHLNMATTAEYYVNMKGVSVDQACTWSTDGSSKGNWAPAVFGVGMDENGKTWLSIQSTIQNNPSSYQDLDFTVELQGDFGGAVCYYTKGHYCTSGSPSSYQSSTCQTTATAKVPGCTVELLSGNATYVLTD